MNKVLAVVAHPDDEILGVGGTLLKHIAKGDEVNILILSDGETSKDNNNIDIERRVQQAKIVANFLCAKNLFLETLPDNKFDSLPLLDIVKRIEKIVYQIEPEIIYTHYAKDLNIDHRLTFQAVLTACRPQPGFFVKKILTFETPSSTEWQIKKQSKLFYPNYYNNISEFIDKKIDALKIYDKELREYPHPRSVKGIEVLAQYRGLEAGYMYAEAFEIIRILQK